MRREGLPVTLVSGMGSSLGDILIRGEGIGALAFVGGRANGRKAATTLADTGRRHFLEQEGLNTWGIWGFTQWDLLAGHLKKGFEYGKQRCTAYPRFVVQRGMFADFLQAYLPVVESLRFGHPLAVENPADPFPELDFGPVISAVKATELRQNFDEAVRGGGIPLVHRSLREGSFLPHQDTSAYVAPACVLQPPSSWALHHKEPFGPLDSIVIVDTEAEFLAAAGFVHQGRRTLPAGAGQQVVPEFTESAPPHGYRPSTVTWQRTPGARDSRASPVTRAVPRASATAIYAAS